MRKLGNTAFSFKRSFLRFALLGVLFLFYPLRPASSASSFSMSLMRTGTQRVAIAIPPFSFVGRQTFKGLSVGSVKIINNDLAESTYFAPLDDRDIMLQLDNIDRRKGYIDFTEWSGIGAEILLKGTLSVANGIITLDCEIYDLYDMNRKIVIQERGPLYTYRQIVHRISDKIIWELFGVKGISTTKLAFISRNKKGHKNIYIADYDGENLRQITIDASINLFPHWSPDSKRIGYTSFKGGNPDLYITDLATRKTDLISAESGVNSHASWSPEGKHMVLSMSVSGNPEVYRLDLESGRRKKLTEARGIDTSPEWSPDGRLISFTSSRSGSPQIYVMNSLGWNVRRITYEGSYNDQSAWSPDGSKLVYSSMKNGHFDIYVIDLLANKATRLTKSRGNDESPSWSPDGRKIVFSSDRNGLYQLFLMDADGANQHKIISLDVEGYDPDWSPHIN